MKPRLLDLFCGAGGAAMGYYRAGFEVVGVDIKTQPHYPFQFCKIDALELMDALLSGMGFTGYRKVNDTESEYSVYHLKDFDAYHASPPCQLFTAMQRICKNHSVHRDFIKPIRERLNQTNKPFVIENVVGAPIRVDLLLCGSMFGLNIIRHRIFESNAGLPFMTLTCHHDNVYDPWHGIGGVGQREKLINAMHVDWEMTRPEIREAIPPAYTEYIGKFLMQAVLGDR